MSWTNLPQSLCFAVLESLAEALIIIDVDEQIIELNDASVNFLGYSSPDMLRGKVVSDLFGSQELIGLVGVRESLTDGAVKQLNVTFLMANGEEKPGTLSASIFRDDHGVEHGIAVLMHDENALQADLAQSSRWAADEKEKADKLSIARDALAKANREIKDTHAQLMVASRQAGMAEIASGVLHNVGNILNAVNVSSQIVLDNLRRSKIGGFLRSTDLLAEHQDNFIEFIRDDPRGVKVLSYQILLADQLRNELKTNLNETVMLQEKVDHIKTIISSQQEFAKRVGVDENVVLEDLLEHALSMQEALFAQNDIKVLRDYGNIAPFLIDKHKVLQIVINILSNAKHALMMDDSIQNPALTIQTQRLGDEKLTIKFIDNGVGIEPVALKRIFNHGFTTKKDGHGFGLHSCANAAKEMGGSLKADSEGPGHGATFTLELPYRTEETPPPPDTPTAS
jgi:PAS domain S-box-containing protein